MNDSSADRIIHDLKWLDDISPERMEAMTAEERISLMWPMAMLEWARRGIDVSNQPFRRDVARLARRIPDGSERVIWQSDACDDPAASGGAK